MSIIASFIVPHPPLAIPEVGRGSEKQITLTIDSYNRISKEIAELKPDTIIISSPHAPYLYNSFFISNTDKMIGDMGNFGANDITFNENIDIDLVSLIKKYANEDNLLIEDRKYDILDHGTMVPLYFIRKYLKKYNIVVMGLCDISLEENYKMGKAIQKAVDESNKNVVFVASGDLSHKLQEYGPYGFTPEGPVYDRRIMDDCSKANFNNLLDYNLIFLETVAQCGHRSFCMMAGALDNIKVKSMFYSHEDVTGVGYGIISYYPDSSDPYVALARETIIKYISTGKIINTSSVTDQYMLNNKAGVFVSIHKFGMLRGCIGTFLPTRSNIAEEIINNAISASTEDPRFIPIKKEELEDLDINVDVLTAPEDISSKDELDPKRYGVIVSSGLKRGLLLPDLEGVDTIDEQIDIAKRKAGITDNEVITLKRFEVVRHK